MAKPFFESVSEILAGTPLTLGAAARASRAIQDAHYALVQEAVAANTAKIVAWLRAKAEALEEEASGFASAGKTGVASEAIQEAATLRELADAIERGEYAETPGSAEDGGTRAQRPSEDHPEGVAEEAPNHLEIKS